MHMNLINQLMCQLIMNINNCAGLIKKNQAALVSEHGVSMRSLVSWDREGPQNDQPGATEERGRHSALPQRGTPASLPYSHQVRLQVGASQSWEGPSGWL